MTGEDTAMRAARADLGVDERILWTGRSDPVAVLISEGYSFAFGGIWTAFVGHFLETVWGKGDTMGMIVGVLLFAIGIFILTRPIAASRAARRTMFAITDRRLLIVGEDGAALTSLLLSRIGQVERRIQRGRITLRIPTSLVSDGDGGQKVNYIDMHRLE